MGPDGNAEDIQAACEAYDRALAEAGGVDLQLLGIGTDGHIGFNEPCSSLASRTRIKTLTEQTRDRQRALLRGARAGAAPRHHAGHRDHPGGPAPGAARHRRGQGRGGRAGRRGAGRRAGARVRAPAPPARHGRGRRGRGVPAEARRLLPGDVRRQARLAGRSDGPPLHSPRLTAHDIDGAGLPPHEPGTVACIGRGYSPAAGDDLRRGLPHTRAAPCVAMCRAPGAPARGRPISTTSVRGRAASSGVQGVGHPGVPVGVPYDGDDDAPARRREHPAARWPCPVRDVASLYEPVSVPGSSARPARRRRPRGSRHRPRCSRRG